MGGTPPAEPPPPPAAHLGAPTTKAPSLLNRGTPSSGEPPAPLGLTSSMGPPSSHPPGGPDPHSKSWDPGVSISNSSVPPPGGAPSLKGLPGAQGSHSNRAPGGQADGPSASTRGGNSGSSSGTSTGTRAPGTSPAAAGNHLTPSSRGSRIAEKAAMDSWLKLMYGASVRLIPVSTSLEVISEKLAQDGAISGGALLPWRNN